MAHEILRMGGWYTLERVSEFACNSFRKLAEENFEISLVLRNHVAVAVVERADVLRGKVLLVHTLGSDTDQALNHLSKFSTPHRFPVSHCETCCGTPYYQRPYLPL